MGGLPSEPEVFRAVVVIALGAAAVIAVALLLGSLAGVIVGVILIGFGIRALRDMVRARMPRRPRY